jgi:hypothetical protein
MAGIDERFEPGAIRLSAGHSRRQGVAGAAEPVGHAPAAASDRTALGLEERFEVGPALWR